ncbi:MAG: hypothetical protein WD200_02640 [Candidatus Andersenbacteria bacterium]
MRLIPLILLIVFLVIAIVAGVVYGLRRNESSPATSGGSLVISEILVGLRTGENPLDPANPRIKQRDTYTTDDPLMLRATATGTSTPYTLSVRLLTQTQSAVPLTPSQITLQSGKSTFCCWKIADPGKYTLQIFRPGGGVTSIPLNILQGDAAKKPPEIIR